MIRSVVKSFKVPDVEVAAARMSNESALTHDLLDTKKPWSDLTLVRDVVRRGSISSELLVCGGGVRSILLLPLVARCLETIDVCIWCMFVFMSVVVTVWECLLCSGRC